MTADSGNYPLSSDLADIELRYLTWQESLIGAKPTLFIVCVNGEWRFKVPDHLDPKFRNWAPVEGNNISAFRGFILMQDAYVIRTVYEPVRLVRGFQK